MDEEIQQVRENLVIAAELQAEIGRRLGDPQIVALGEAAALAWATVATSGIQMLFPEEDNGLPRLEKLRWQTDRMRDIRDGLSPPHANRRATGGDPNWPVADCALEGSGAAGLTAAEKTQETIETFMDCGASAWIRAIEVLTPGIRSEDDDWPVADCSLIVESAVSWQGLTTAIEALEAAEAACDAIATVEVVSTPLTVIGECAGGGFPEGIIEGSIGVTTEAVFTWEGGWNNPALCAGAETAMEAAWKSSEIVSGYLECWTDAYLDSNYECLDTLQDEVLEAYDDLELIYNIFVERSLHKTGGSSLAALYLPESAGGEPESVAEIVTNAGENTAAAGYRLPATG
jgi:hypothetical protein